MRRLSMIVASTLLMAAASPLAKLTDATLRAADAEQMRILVQQDVKAQQEFMHPNYIFNNPANRILRKSEAISMLAHGDMASNTFERVIEGTAITGDVGIVMGREVGRPSLGSELGKLHPGKTLQRRFTNVFIFQSGKWRFLARQATVVGSE